MKKIILILALLMLSITINAQDYNKWAISGEFGNQMVADESAVSGEDFSHFGLGIRYNLNEIVGVGLTGGYDFTSLYEEYNMDGESFYGPEYDFEYGRVNLEGYLNAFKALDLYSKNWTVLFHGGPGASFIKSKGLRLDENAETESFRYKQTLLNLRGGASILYKISRSVVAYADFSMTSNVNQPRKFNGNPTIKVTNAGMSSNISNISVGLTLYLGKKDKEHADWYVAEPIKPTVTHVTTINEYPTTEVTKVIEKTCDCDTEPTSEYVFFDHDKDVIRDTELNAIYKAYAELDENPDYKLIIKGFASPTSSSADYNQKLSERRTNTLKIKFIKMGIDESRITTGSYGKDLARDAEIVHDVARRVELLIVKK